MKRICASALIAVFALPAYAADVQSEVMQQLKAFDSAYDQGDFDALGQMYQEDAKVYPQGYTRHGGSSRDSKALEIL